MKDDCLDDEDCGGDGDDDCLDWIDDSSYWIDLGGDDDEAVVVAVAAAEDDD